MGLILQVNTMEFCDLKCKYAQWPEELSDGSKSCRTFVGLWCKLKKRIVHKNAPCKDKKDKKNAK
jgi:hypothetical protein